MIPFDERLECRIYILRDFDNDNVIYMDFRIVNEYFIHKYDYLNEIRYDRMVKMNEKSKQIMVPLLKEGKDLIFKHISHIKCFKFEEL